MIDGRFVSLGPNKPFQTLKHHNLLLICAEVRFGDLNSYAYVAAFWELVQSLNVITIEYLLSEEVQAPEVQVQEVFRTDCLNDQSNTDLLSAIR